jgi:hypothetical protein
MTQPLADLPDNIARKQLLDTKQAAAFVARSPIEIRRLVNVGKFPKPLNVDGKKWSFRLGDLVDFIDSKAAAAAG